MKQSKLERLQAKARGRNTGEVAVEEVQQDALPEYLTPAEVAAKLKISTKQVIRLFEGRSGVLNLGGERKPTKRDKRSKYTILRIPPDAVKQLAAEKVA